MSFICAIFTGGITGASYDGCTDQRPCRLC